MVSFSKDDKKRIKPKHLQAHLQKFANSITDVKLAVTAGTAVTTDGSYCCSFTVVTAVPAVTANFTFIIQSVIQTKQ
ncbi:hypothetical protein ACF0H5_007057 [Mactra antiquata]